MNINKQCGLLLVLISLICHIGCNSNKWDETSAGRNIARFKFYDSIKGRTLSDEETQGLINYLGYGQMAPQIGLKHLLIHGSEDGIYELLIDNLNRPEISKVKKGLILFLIYKLSGDYNGIDSFLQQENLDDQSLERILTTIYYYLDSDIDSDLVIVFESFATSDNTVISSCADSILSLFPNTYDSSSIISRVLENTESPNKEVRIQAVITLANLLLLENITNGTNEELLQSYDKLLHDTDPSVRYQAFILSEKLFQYDMIRNYIQRMAFSDKDYYIRSEAQRISFKYIFTKYSFINAVIIILLITIYVRYFITWRRRKKQL